MNNKVYRYTYSFMDYMFIDFLFPNIQFPTLMVAARSRVSARKTARLISATWMVGGESSLKNRQFFVGF